MNFSTWEKYQEFPQRYLSSYDYSALEKWNGHKKRILGEKLVFLINPLIILLGGFYCLKLIFIKKFVIIYT